jgi:transposase
MERVEQRRGGNRKVTAAVEQQLREWVLAQPDLTLAELQQKLAQTQPLQVSIGRLWQVLRQMGLRLKKSHSTPSGFG